MEILIILVCVIVALILLGWLGLQIKPKSFPAYPQQTPKMKSIPLPTGLPVPVERFYRQIYGDDIPVIESAVISGRMSFRPVGGITFPGRFRFTHIAGEGYRHYFEATFFGLPVFKGNEHYLDGKGVLELPFGLSDRGENIDQAANLSLWAEYAWLPAVLITNPRVQWEPLDADTAILVVPFGEHEQRFVTRFNPRSGLLSLLESMRYKDSKSETKTLWFNESTGSQTIGNTALPATGAVTWFDQGKPWAVFTVEDIVYNSDVSKYIRAYGP